jgi:hypothetical protein
MVMQDESEVHRGDVTVAYYPGIQLERLRNSMKSYSRQLAPHFIIEMLEPLTGFLDSFSII